MRRDGFESREAIVKMRMEDVMIHDAFLCGFVSHRIAAWAGDGRKFPSFPSLCSWRGTTVPSTTVPWKKSGISLGPRDILLFHVYLEGILGISSERGGNLGFS